MKVKFRITFGSQSVVALIAYTPALLKTIKNHNFKAIF